MQHVQRVTDVQRRIDDGEALLGRVADAVLTLQLDAEQQALDLDVVQRQVVDVAGRDHGDGAGGAAVHGRVGHRVGTVLVGEPAARPGAEVAADAEAPALRGRVGEQLDEGAAGHAARRRQRCDGQSANVEQVDVVGEEHLAAFRQAVESPVLDL